MNIKSITTIYFSPTGGTKKVATILTDMLFARLSIPAKMHDITSINDRRGKHEFDDGTLLLATLPTYAGKLPNKILQDLERIFSKNTSNPAVAIVTFGNRSFDNSLAELGFLLSNSGFSILGGGAFVTQHPFSENVGTFRPDATDIMDMDKFTSDLCDIVADFQMNPAKFSESNIILPKFPGKPDAPYYTPLGLDGQPAKFLKATPFTNVESCINCGKCADVCPMSVIDFDDVSKITGPCIKCYACIRICPMQAKLFTDEAFLSHVSMLEKNYTKRQKNYFISASNKN